MKANLLVLATLVACGEVKDARHLPDAGAPATEIAIDAIVIADGECGAQPAPRAISFVNTGAGPLEWSATIDGAGFSIAGATSGSAEPEATATVSVQPSAVPSTASVGEVIEAMLVIQTNARAEPFVVPLSMQVHGGSLLVETPSVAFGQIQVSVPAGATPLVIRNQGDRAIQVALGSTTTSEFSATWAGAPNAATIAPQEELAGAMTGFTPATDGARADSVAILATGPMCAGDVANVALSGEGTFAQVGVTPGSIPFGTTPCGSTASTRDVTITNNYGVAITYTATVMSGPYAIAAANQSGSIPANSSVMVPVTANAVPRAPASLAANALDGSVRVTTSAPGHAPATISLDQAASGAVLALAPATGSTVAFGTVVAGSPESQSYTVTNTGNVAASVTVAATGSGFSATAPGNGSIPANGVAQAGSITQDVIARGTHAGTFTLSTSTNRCQTAAPGSLSLTATAQAPVMQLGRVDTMSLQCGGGVSPTISIPIRNTGDVPLTLTSPSVTAGFTLLSTLPLTIAAGDTAQVQVRAAAAVIGVDRGGTSRTGTLTVRTNEIGAPQRTIDLAADINGANIDFEYPVGTPITSMAFNTNMTCPGDRIIGIHNTGNQAISILEWGLNTPHFRFAGHPPTLMLPAGETTPTVIEVQVLDQDCAITAPELLRIRALGTNICTARNAQSEAVLSLTYSIAGFSTCNCN